MTPMTTRTYTETAYGETLCGLCDSDNTGSRRTQGEFTYTVEVACYDCGFGTEHHYTPTGTTGHSGDLAHRKGRCVDPAFWGCPDEAH